MNKVQYSLFAGSRRFVSVVWPVLGLILAGVQVAAAETQRRQARVPATVSQSNAERTVFRVSVERPRAEPSPALDGAYRLSLDGYATTGRPGEPALPTRKFLVGLPPAGGYSVSYQVLSSTPLGEITVEPSPYQSARRDDILGITPAEDYSIDPSVYRRFQSPPVVEAGKSSFIRRIRTVPVYVNPVTYDPVSRTAVVATEIEITVTHSGAPGAGVASRNPVPNGPVWDSMFSRLLVNAGQARNWQAPRKIVSPSPASGRVATLAGGPMFRIAVRETGMHRISAATLTAAGFPSSQPISGLHMFQRTYDDDTMASGSDDVAFDVVEGATGVAGVFDGQDRIIFFGRRLRDDPARGDAVEKFSDHNVYWLETASGTRMATRTLTAGTVSGDTTTASFPVDQHFEIDTFFLDKIRPASGPDFYMFNSGTATTSPVEMPFDVNAMVPGSFVHLRAQMIGRSYEGARISVLKIANALGTSVIDPSYSLSDRDMDVYETDQPSNLFAVGTNRFTITRTSTLRPIEVILNWIEVQYQSLFRARADVLRFNTRALAGNASVTVTGIESNVLRLYDITDPLVPVRCDVTVGLFTNVGGSYALSFVDDADLDREYILSPESEMVAVAAGDISADSPSSIVGDPAESGVDVLVVSHALFLSQMQEWVAFRESQGYRVLMVDVEDLYDEFNNGVPGARAIDRFTRRFFELGGAETLLLVGDASKDAKRIHSDSPPNFVPTHSEAEHVNASPSDDEVVTSDKVYALLPDPFGVVDSEFDMVVGRIPVGTVTELARVLFKIFQYERSEPDDSWRRNIVVMADDDYSAGSSTGFNEGNVFCRYGAEAYFQISQEKVAQKLEASPVPFNVERLYLKDFIGYLHTADCVGVTGVKVATRNTATVALMNAIARGASLIFCQAHMNRSQVAHELFFTTVDANVIGFGLGQDHLRLGNSGKPFVMWGLGCHFSDFAIHREEVYLRVLNNNPNGDSFAEQLLFQSNKGAVGVVGSTGFEYLNQTNQYMERTASVWLYEAPYDNLVQQTRAQWLLGQMVMLTELTLAQQSQQISALRRYHILGDPLLRIDAGPPAFTVTVDGVPVQNGALLKSTTPGDTVLVVATIVDENAVHDPTLTLQYADGGRPDEDLTDSLTVTPLIDQTLADAREYRVSFRHKLRAEAYRLVLRAPQLPGEGAGEYTISGEFVLTVPADISLKVDGREVHSGDAVPARANYVIDLTFGVVIAQSSIEVTIDDDPVTGINFSHPAPQDTTSWRLQFARQLSAGAHVLQVTVGQNQFPPVTLNVGLEKGISNLMNYPNPFEDGTSFMFSNDIAMTEGEILVYTTSGRRIRTVPISAEAMFPGDNTVYWDGRDDWGNEIGNGVYLYIVRFRQGGEWHKVTEKLVKMR